MATPNTAPTSGESMPLLPNQQRPEHFNEQDRVLALYFQTWMDEPRIVTGVISDVHEYDMLSSNGSPGFVSIKTAKTSDNRTGSIIGMDMNSVALIPEAALPHIQDDDFLATWLANGSEAWPEERTMLEEALRKRITEGSIGWDMAEDPVTHHHPDHHPSRARKHAVAKSGRVGKIRNNARSVTLYSMDTISADRV